MRAVIVALLVLVTACGDAGDVAPATQAPPATDGTTSPPTTGAPPPPDTSGTTAPATTTLTTETSTGPPTTMPGPVGTPVAASASCVLGWWDGGWVSTADDTSLQPPIDPGDILQVVTLDGATQVQATSLNAYDDIGQPPWWLQTQPTFNSGLATSGTFAMVPHLVEVSSANQQVYLDQAAQLMSQRGFPNVPIELAQVIRFDLEGDGVNEVIVNARHPGAPTYLREVGVFSLIFLRRVVEGDVQTAILHDSVFREEDVGQATSVEHAVVSGIGDLNGDGKMEIAIDGSGYEWYWSEAFEYVNDDLGPTSIMLCGGGV